MQTVNKAFKFCAGHHLEDYDGACSNFHGHNYRLVVTIMGTAELRRFQGDGIYPTMVCDFDHIRRLVSPVVKELDHQNLNEILNPAGFKTTAEDMTKYIYKRLHEIADKMPVNVRKLYMAVYGSISKIRLYETEDCYTDLFTGLTILTDRGPVKEVEEPKSESVVDNSDQQKDKVNIALKDIDKAKTDEENDDDNDEGKDED